MPFDSTANNLAAIPIVSHASGSPSLVLGTGDSDDPVAAFAYVDPDAGSLIVATTDPGSAEFDPDAGSLIIV